MCPHTLTPQALTHVGRSVTPLGLYGVRREHLEVLESDAPPGLPGLEEDGGSLVPAVLLYQLLAAPGLLGAPRARVPGRPYTQGEDPCSVPVSDAGAEGLHTGPSSGLLWVLGRSHTAPRLVSSAPGEAGVRPGRSPALLPPSQAQTGGPRPDPKLDFCSRNGF